MPIATKVFAFGSTDGSDPFVIFDTPDGHTFLVLTLTLSSHAGVDTSGHLVALNEGISWQEIWRYPLLPDVTSQETPRFAVAPNQELEFKFIPAGIDYYCTGIDITDPF